MVMKKNAMRKNLRQSIVRSLGRYIAICAIIALGAGLFLGLVMTKSDMLATGQKFMDEQNMFDLRMVSNYGWTEEYVEEFAALPGIEDAEGLVYLDMIAQVDGEEEAVFRFYSIPERMNRLALRGGRMPETDSECLADGFLYDETILGRQVTISEENEEDSLDSVREKTFTVVGYITSPLYMDMNRGTTSIGSGSLQNYFFLPAGAFDVDYYTEINLTLEGDHEIYSGAYSQALEDTIDAIEPEAEALARRRFDTLKAEIEEEYQEGYQEYLDGLQEYEDGKAEAEQELADAEQELNDAQKELDDGYDQLLWAHKEIKLGYEKIQQSRADLVKQEFALKEQLSQLDSGIAQAQAGVAQAEQIIGMSGTALQEAIAKAQEYAALTDQNAAKAQQDLTAARQTLEQLLAAQEPDTAAIAAAQNAVDAAAQGLTEAQGAAAQAQQKLEGLRALQEIYNKAAGPLAQLMGYKAQAEEGMQKIQAGHAALTQSQIDLENTESMLNIRWGEWAEGRDELEEGWEEFEEAKLEVAQELADAEAELEDARQELADARQEIDDMEEPDLIILDRESNIGYNNLDSSSDIVAGVSRVFPVFFLLIASLVCITTMSRMIDEERTQIGTLKALGYSNAEIISKYLIYSGSSAVIGCTLGIAVGCTIFPQIIWEAYKILLYIQPDVILTVNWLLAAGVLLVYLAVILAVTWYCCSKTLQEEPAQLIRPKAPDAGKKLILEYLPIWEKVRFLNKVTIRNIFQYRQRMAMMLIGIGGCTALLIAGLGLRDSVVNVVDYQFRDVTHYDVSVYFREELTEKEAQDFEKAIRGKAEDWMYYHQSSVELENPEAVKEVYMISGDSGLEHFITLHSGESPISLPGKNQVVVSVGVAESMGLKPGDTVTIRSADLEEMELTVSGIYENYIYNYCIVAPDTIEAHWGEAPKLQMAFVTAAQGQSVHNLGAAIVELDTVLNVTISEDLAEMVSSMMQALDLVVLVAVLSAALLAVIVLYNLTNININERIREIATIKVLGFRAMETASYVFKENMVLTCVGSLVGLVMGKLLLEFIMIQVKIDMVWLKAVLTPQACILAVVLTLLSSILVEVLFYFKLDKINMAEALKSVE